MNQGQLRRLQLIIIRLFVPGWFGLSSKASEMLVLDATTLKAAISVVRQLLPDVLLCHGSYRAVGKVRLACSRQTRMVELLDDPDLLHLAALMNMQVEGYGMRHEDPALIPAAMRAVSIGAGWMRPQVAARFADYVVCRSARPEIHSTAREHQVIELLAVGESDVAISQALHISPRTVCHHTEQLRAKLGLETRTSLVAWAARRSRGRIPRADASM